MAMIDELPLGFRSLRLSRGIHSSARRTPAKVALIFGERRLSYSELSGRIQQVSNAIEACGIGIGETVALIAPNCLEYAEIVAGVSDAGAIAVTLNPKLTPAELAPIVADCRPRLLIVHESCKHPIDGFATTGVPTWVIGDDYERQLRSAKPYFEPLELPEWNSFSLCYTSGTTGNPKGVLLSHRSRSLAFLMVQAEYGCFGPDDHFLAVSPQYHGAGLAFSLAPLALGGTCTLFDRFDPEIVLDRLGQGDITSVFMVPTHFHRLLQLPHRVLSRASDGHRLKAIISNAAALPQTIKERVIDLFGEGLLHETYGSTEVGFVTNIRPRDHRRKPGSVGVPFSGMEIEIRSPDGTALGAGEVGELFARGPTTFNGYLNLPDETLTTIHEGGWVTVGDLAMRDEDGFYYIVDRKKDMVVTGGVNVYPREVENVIADLPGVAEVAVIGLPHPEWGEQLHAFIVPAGGGAPDSAQLIAACRTRLAGFKVPRGVSIVTELPRNTSGKILKRLLREQMLET